MFGLVLRHRTLTHERVVASKPDTVEMSKSGRPGRAAARATFSPATVDVGAEKFEAGSDADVSVEVAVVGGDRRRLHLDVVASRSDTVKVLA